MWKDIIIDNIITNYEVSNDGQVRNKITNNILSQRTQQGYKHVTLSINKTSKSCRVHRLVATAFIPNPQNKPFVNHIDGCRNNNNLENLEWVTPAENTQPAIRTGLMKPTRERAVIQYDLDGNKIAEYVSISEASRQTNSLPEKIVMCCNFQRSQHNQFQWRYKNDEVDRLQKIELASNLAKKVAQIDIKTGEILHIYNSYSEAARAVHGTQSAITHVIKGDKQTKTHKGFGWKLVEEIVQNK